MTPREGSDSKDLARVSKKQDLPVAELEPHEEAAYDPFRRTHDEQFVVHRGGLARFTEHIAHPDQHFPSRRMAERHERERLIDLNVESVVERWT